MGLFASSLLSILELSMVVFSEGTDELFTNFLRGYSPPILTLIYGTVVDACSFFTSYFVDLIIV